VIPVPWADKVPDSENTPVYRELGLPWVQNARFVAPKSGNPGSKDTLDIWLVPRRFW